jgi:Zn-dependent protease/predicted transcriptional regulator
MRRRIFRVGGAEVAAHPGWLVGFLLVTAALAFIGLPTGGEEAPVALTWAFAALGAVALFGSVLVHELTHALVARRLGLPTRPVTLFAPTGGAVAFEGETVRPGQEFLVAASGPFVSLVIGALFAAAALALELVGAPEALVNLSALGAAVNGILGALNLVPALPLDGGRILRAVLWRVGGDFLVATHRAANTGRAVGWMAVGAGLLIAWRSDMATGFAVALIGWFLSRFATTAYRWEAMRRTVDGVRVGEVMERDAPTVWPNLTLDVFVEQYLLSGTGSAFAVISGDEPIGTIDVERARRVPRDQWPSRRIADVMTPISDVRTARQDDPLWSAIESFERERLHVMPVIEGGRLVGVLTRDGLLSVIRGRTRLVTQ